MQQSMYEDRSLHISRLPSSSLLGSKADSQPFRARLVRLHLQPDVSIDAFSTKWQDATTDAHAAITWDLLSSTINRHVLYVVAKQRVTGGRAPEAQMSLEASLARWFSAVGGYLSKPSSNSQLIPVAESDTAYPNFVCLETVHVKPGQESDFGAFAREWLEPSEMGHPARLISLVQTEVPEPLGHSIMQDASNSTIFYIVYHFSR